ncbi:MAG: TrbC/VirB2 family protein [Clostridia bacterium]|nr:TrbC/VirB2 family protein [Clostridia bacterium]
MKKFLKILVVAVVAVMLICSFALASNPFDVGSNNGGEIGTAVTNVGQTAIGVVQTIGYIMAVFMVIWTGVQWVMAPPAKKQELKGKLWNIVIGAVLIVGAVTLLGLVNKTFNGLNLDTANPTQTQNNQDNAQPDQG